MKKLKEHWKTIVVGVIALLVVTYGIIQFSIKFEEKELAKAKTTLTEKQIEDKIKSKIENAKNAEIDSLKQANFKRIAKYIDEVAYHKKMAENARKSANLARLKADSLAKLFPECKDVADAYRTENDSLREENNHLDKENENLDNEAKTYSENWYLCEQQYKYAERTILRKDSLINQQSLAISKLEKNNSKYWKGFKDGFKWGFGTAVVIETGAIILLKR